MKRFKKILIITLIFIFLTEFCFSSGIINTSMISYSADMTEEEVKQRGADVANEVMNGLGNVLEGIIGILLWRPKVYLMVAAIGLQAIGGSLASVAGTVGIPLFTPDSIFFNKYNVTNVDFFDDSFKSNTGMIAAIRDNVALWYYVMVIIASTILLLILIYVGIRMVLSTVASEKAKYKKMLVDWVTSLALIFLLHFIIVATFKVNNALVGIFEEINGSSGNNGKLDNIAASLLAASLNINVFVGFGSIILYLFLQLETFVFLLMYIKRMFTVAFLIIIAPLITITYSIDKMGDQKAQALNNWLKEFLFNVLIQPFHCILYLAFASIGIGLVTGGEGVTLESFLPWGGDGSLGGFFLALIAFKFILDGEKIVKKIFGFEQASSLGSALPMAGMLASTLAKGTSMAGNAVGKVGDVGKKFAGSEGLRGLVKNPVPESVRNSAVGKKVSGMTGKASNWAKNRAKDRSIGKIKSSMVRNGYGATADIDEKANKIYEEKQAKRREKNEQRRQKISTATTKVGGALTKASESKTFRNGVAMTAGTLTAMATYLASEDETGFIPAAITGKNVYDTTKGNVAKWQKRKSASYENESVGNFKAFATMNNMNSDLSTEEGMENYKRYVRDNYDSGKYGDAYSAKANQEASKDFDKAFDGKMDIADISHLKAQLALALSDENARNFDPEQLYRQNNIQSKTGMSYDEFEATIRPYVNQQLGSNLYNNTEQFDAVMDSRGLDHETAIQNVEENHERYNGTTSTTNTHTQTNTNTSTETIVQTIGEDEIRNAIPTGIDLNDQTQINTAIDNLARIVETRLSNLGSDIGDETRTRDITNQVRTEIQNAINSGREINISSIGGNDTEKKYARTVLQQHYITSTSGKNEIEKYIRNQNSEE